jgi:hypothetical protein
MSWFLTNDMLNHMRCVFSTWNLQLRALCIVSFYSQLDLLSTSSLSMSMCAGLILGLSNYAVIGLNCNVLQCKSRSFYITA